MNDPSELPPVEEMIARLKRAGWSIGDVGFAGDGERVWVVSGTNGENRIVAEGTTEAEAWWRACEQARAVGMLGR
jgi:hypothetical protein